MRWLRVSGLAALLLAACGSTALAATKAPAVLPLVHVQVRVPNSPASGPIAELNCPSNPPPPLNAVASRTQAPVPPVAETSILPDADSIDASGSPTPLAPAQDRLDDLLRSLSAGRQAPLRVAIWGDSHLAAGFFTDTLLRQTGLPADRIQNQFLPGSINRPGIRLALRKSCLSSGWRHEPGYLNGNGVAPGPGLVNLSTSEPGAWFTLDLRNAAGQPERRPVRLLYQQTPTPIQLAVSIDGGQEYQVELPGGPAGPAELDLVHTAPLSQLKLRLLDGALRWHGLGFGLPISRQPALLMDVFGFPGATINAWRQVDLAYLGSWFQGRHYDVVMLEYGTNEANARSFDPQAYQQGLRQAVTKLMAVFPHAACVLIAPGDRGTWVARSEAPPAIASSALSGVDLLRFSRLHAEVGRIQHRVAQDHGCRLWSMQTAMGGLGSSYQWVRQSPALMARDLIHFTVPGYQQLARQFFIELGWSQIDWARIGQPAPTTAATSLGPGDAADVQVR